MQVSKQSTRFKVIWQQATLLYYHICQVAALVTNLLVCNPILGEGRSYGVDDGTIQNSGFL